MKAVAEWRSNRTVSKNNSRDQPQCNDDQFPFGREDSSLPHIWLPIQEAFSNMLTLNRKLQSNTMLTYAWKQS